MPAQGLGRCDTQGQEEAVVKATIAMPAQGLGRCDTARRTWCTFAPCIAMPAQGLGRCDRSARRMGSTKRAQLTTMQINIRTTNAERLAELVYSLVKESAPHLGIDLVRPPNPAHGNAVAVLFSDGRDVVITFTEKK